jgi:hypothetical protein
MNSVKSAISATAARLIVENGLEYGPAKRQALKHLGLPARSALPDNDELEDAVLEHIALFRADSQAVELLALRRLALVWMQRMAEFCPHLGGAVWHGSATRLSDVYLHLFCDDPKTVEICLIDHRTNYVARSTPGRLSEPIPTLSVHAFCPDLNEDVGVHLVIHDHDAIRGALRPDPKGRRPYGDLAALQHLVHDRQP